jgi:hypothetical protein
MVAVPSSMPEDNLRRIQEIRRDIETLNKELYTKQRKKLTQQQTGETVPKLEEEIARIQSKLDQQQAELGHLEGIAAPSAFFAVQRRLKPNGRHRWVEEQPIEVSVEITNLGHLAVDIRYKEGLSDGLEISKGTLDLEALVGPGATAVLSYICYGTRPGKHRMFTEHIDYEGRSSAWNKIEEREVEVGAGTDPLLLAARYYRYEKDGLQLLVHLENRGHKIARNVRYKEEISIDGQAESIMISFQDDLWGGAPGHTIERLLPAADPEKVHFPAQTEITYSDSQGRAQSFILDPGWKRVEYNFPKTPTDIAIVGRETETQLISKMVDQAWQQACGQPVPGLKHLLFIKGIEGAGKTRLVYELIAHAQRRGFNCFVEDVKDRSPVKRILRQLLGLRPDEDDDRLLWERLQNHLPSGEQSAQRGIVFRFISTIATKSEQDELNVLEANVLAFFKTLCRRVPTVLVFENIHWTQEGLEGRLLLRLFEDAVASIGEPTLLCATYRPVEMESLLVVSELRRSRERYETITLETIGEEGTKALVGQIVDFPCLSAHSSCEFSRENKN